MYTRFKSQKSGLKLGLNTISNPTRARVVIPATAPVATTTSTASKAAKTPLDSSGSKSESLNSSSSTSLSSIPNAVLGSAIVASTASVVVSDHQEPATSVFAAPKTHKKDLSRNKSQEESSNEEIVDPSTISYVQSLWEKYTSELGTQDGPLRYENPSAEYPHLNGFVAFDMEHWWAERSISSMINEKSLNSPSTSSSSPLSSSLKHSHELLTPSSSSATASSSSSATASSISSPTQLASPTLLAASGDTSGTNRSFEMNDLMLMNAFTKPASIKSLQFRASAPSSSVLGPAKFNSNVQMCFS